MQALNYVPKREIKVEDDFAILVPAAGHGTAIGHVNRFLGLTLTFTGGTGRFAAVNGAPSGTFASRVIAVDPATGIAHKHLTSKSVGTLTFPSKL